MSAPKDSAVSSGNAPSDDNARLDQPSDAVPMEKMSETAPAAIASDNSNVEPKGDNADEPKAPGGDDSTDAPAVVAEPEPTSTQAAVDETVADKEDDPNATKAKDKQSDAPRPPAKEREDSMAIGPATDDAKTVAQGGTDGGPVCIITLLLTTGSRHPYKIDGRYLNRRNVDIPDVTESGQPDPSSISIYTLKELILREWRNDWEAKPASPSSIRLIHFGKLLDDKEQLKKYQFSTENPNVVHMSIRPADLDEEEPKTGGKNPTSGAGEGQRERSSACCVVL